MPSLWPIRLCWCELGSANPDARGPLVRCTQSGAWQDRVTPALAKAADGHYRGLNLAFPTTPSPLPTKKGPPTSRAPLGPSGSPHRCSTRSSTSLAGVLPLRGHRAGACPPWRSTCERCKAPPPTLTRSGWEVQGGADLPSRRTGPVHRGCAAASSLRNSGEKQGVRPCP